jgi:hypothetical protein
MLVTNNEISEMPFDHKLQIHVVHSRVLRSTDILVDSSMLYQNVMPMPYVNPPLNEGEWLPISAFFGATFSGDFVERNVTHC